MKIDVHYNEFTNWPMEVTVRHPNCEHLVEHRDTIEREWGRNHYDKVTVCMVCHAQAVPDYDNEEYDWVGGNW